MLILLILKIPQDSKWKHLFYSNNKIRWNCYISAKDTNIFVQRKISSEECNLTRKLIHPWQRIVRLWQQNVFKNGDLEDALFAGGESVHLSWVFCSAIRAILKFGEKFPKEAKPFSFPKGMSVWSWSESSKKYIFGQWKHRKSENPLPVSATFHSLLLVQQRSLNLFVPRRSSEPQWAHETPDMREYPDFKKSLDAAAELCWPVNTKSNYSV